ncbi:hypothetical protein [Actinomadura hibisca]|uniref:hypothetical protein n=1 Tax=Actinomadura hibisca TaxID=68565 RepID=UPI000833118C|nr:hypothetical protein [Actinomadura hibisca]
MEVNEYGYQVLHGAAGDVPGVVDEVRSGFRAGLAWGAPVLAVQLVAVAFLLSAGGSAAFLGAMLGVTALVTLGLVVLWLRARVREHRILRTCSWQVWPCRIDQVRVVSGEGTRANGRRWSSDTRVILLKPDGQAHCSFPAPGPGVGTEVWFAGDMGGDGILAVPGGRPWRHVSRNRR